MHTGFLRKFLTDDVAPRDAILLVAGSVALLALAGWRFWQLAPPPKRVVMTTGAKDGAYHAYAQRYREELAKFGVTLEHVKQQQARLAAVDAQLHTLRVPKAYLGDLYTLREHAQYVRRALERAGAPGAAA